jgi:hypothetical protein
MVLPHLLPAIALENYVPDRSENAIAKFWTALSLFSNPYGCPDSVRAGIQRRSRPKRERGRLSSDGSACC